MTTKTKLPADFVAEGLRLAKGGSLYGVPFEDLSRDELIAAAAMGWKAHNDQLRQSIDSFSFMSELRSKLPSK